MIQRILVGTGASDDAGPALEAAAELARSYDAELVVLQVEAMIDARHVFDPDGVPEPRNHLVPLRRDYPGLRVRSQRARGNALRTVCEVAEAERPDLIVVQHDRRSRISGLLSRRASSALAQMAHCPVLLVAS